MAAHDGGASGVAGGNLFKRDSQRDGIRSDTTPLLRHGHAEEAQAPHLRQRVARKGFAAVPSGGIGFELLARKLACCVADHGLLFVEHHGNTRVMRGFKG